MLQIIWLTLDMASLLEFI
ncbi:hypothetical protein LINPERHAP1_LOCUS16045 [Linum perenne]